MFFDLFYMIQCTLCFPPLVFILIFILFEKEIIIKYPYFLDSISYYYGLQLVCCNFED